MKKIVLALLMCLLPVVAHSTVSSTVTKNTYSCDGVTTAWDYTFPIISSSDINVYVTDSTGLITQVVAGFSVNTGTKKVTYPTSGTICPSGYSVTLIRNVPLTQSLVLTTQGPFPATSLNTSHDKLTMIAQQAQEQLDRSVKLPITSTSAPSLPTPQDGYSLVWSGSNLVNSLLTGPAGPTGATGPAGSGSGDVLGPATNTINYIPQWSGANNKTLKDGLAAGTSAYNLVQLDSLARLPALDGSLLTNVPVSVGSVSGASLTSLGSIPGGAGSIPSANITSLPDSSLATITTAGKVSGASLTLLGNTPYAAGLLPSANLATVAIAQGGTGQVTAQAAIDALTAVSGATNEYVLTKDTATGNAKFKALAVTTPTASAGNNFVVNLTGTTYTSSDGTYTKYVEVCVPKSGTVRVSFYLDGGGALGKTAYAQIYKNGSAVGTERTKTNGAPTTYTEDISGLAIGDLLQLYLKQAGGTTSIVTVFTIGESVPSQYAINLK